MWMAITIWTIGWMFSLGVVMTCMGIELNRPKLPPDGISWPIFLAVIAILAFLWPIFLGVLVVTLIEFYDPVGKPLAKFRKE